MAILKISKEAVNTEEKERQFTIREMLKMSTDELYQMMFEKSKIIREMMALHGHRPAIKIIKRRES